MLMLAVAMLSGVTSAISSSDPLYPCQSKPCALPAAVQRVYMVNGVPHTDRNGRPRRTYDAQQSFLPLILHDAQMDCGAKDAARDLGDECLPTGYDASLYARANYTGVLPYKGFQMAAYMDGYARAGLQVIRQGPNWNDPSCPGHNLGPNIVDDVRTYKDHPAMLGWMLYEEPTGRYWGNDTHMQEVFAQYQAEYKSLRSLDAVHPVFVLDDSWITEPATQVGRRHDCVFLRRLCVTGLTLCLRQWWKKWNSYGDVTCHDNYPLDFRVETLARSNGQGVPATVGLATKIVNESKPVWLTVQAWEDGPWQMPSARELRGQVYTGIVHGATGIQYFAMDSYVTRAGNVIGMGPRELLNGSYPGHHFPSTNWYIASPSLLDMAAAAWDAAATINGELLELMPAIFSPTSAKPYAVSFQGTYSRSS